MKQYVNVLIIFTLLAVTIIMFIGPYNLYHYFNAEKIVKEKSLFFLKEGENLDDLSQDMDAKARKRFVGNIEDIQNVSYLGSNAFLIDVKTGDNVASYIWINNSTGKHRYDQEIYNFHYAISMIGYPDYIEHNRLYFLAMIGFAISLMTVSMLWMRKKFMK